MKKLAIALVVICLSQFARGLTISYGTTVTLNSTILNENIIIEPYATLVIDGDIFMGHLFEETEYFILIQNHGRLISDGGSISGTYLLTGDNRQWYGIIVESTDFAAPSMSAAVDLKNFTIKHAHHAIELPKYSSILPETSVLINRRIDLSQTTFDNNKVHIFMGTSGYLFGTKYDEFNQKNGVNNINIIHSNFLGARNAWSFWVTYTRNVILRDCLFDDNIGGTDYGLHFNSVDNLSVSDCMFKRTGRRTIVFHGLSDYVRVLNCDFIVDETTHPGGLPSEIVGISVGAETSNQGAVSNVYFYDNFFSYPIGVNSYGIICGYLMTSPGSGPSIGNPGYIHSGSLEENIFFGALYPISINNASALHILPNFTTTPQSLKIKNNMFQTYYMGLTVAGHHEGTTVECNWFHQGAYGLILENETVVSGPIYMPNFTSGIGSANLFADCKNTDLFNATLTPFVYEVSVSNIYPPTTTVGFLSLPSVVPILTCNNEYPY